MGRIAKVAQSEQREKVKEIIGLVTAGAQKNAQKEQVFTITEEGNYYFEIYGAYKDAPGSGDDLSFTFFIDNQSIFTGNWDTIADIPNRGFGQIDSRPHFLTVGRTVKIRVKALLNGACALLLKES